MTFSELRDLIDMFDDTTLNTTVVMNTTEDVYESVGLGYIDAEDDKSAVSDAEESMLEPPGHPYFYPINGQSVTKFNDKLGKFIETYGIKGLGLLVSTYIKLSPEFEEDEGLAKEIGKAIAMLEDGLDDIFKRGE